MEVKKKNKKVDISEQRLEKSGDPLQEEKDKLKKQIAKLRTIIPQLECELELYPFKNVITDSKSNAPDTSLNLNNLQIPNVNVELELQLFRFAGFRCHQFNKQEFVFNLSSSNKYDKNNIFGVQVLYKNTKWSLGKWTMPMSIDLEDLVGHFSNNIRDVPNFIRTCRHYIDCYFIRCEQFNALKETISSTKNSTLQANEGYTHMMINLIGVHSAEYNDYTNVLIHIEYNIDEIWPNKVDIDLQNEQLNAKVKQQFKNSVKCLKSLDLSIAFENMWNDSPFTWSKEADKDSPLEINNSDGSDENDFLVNSTLRSSKSRRKSQRKRRKGDLYISRNVERNNKPAALQNEKRNTQNLSQYSTNENKNNEAGPSTSHVNKNKETVTSTSHVHNLNQKKLKQAKLNFRSTKISHVNPDTSRSLVTPEKDALHWDVDKVITSTPMQKNDFIVTEMGDFQSSVSSIVSEKQTTTKISIKKRKRNK